MAFALAMGRTRSEDGEDLRTYDEKKDADMYTICRIPPATHTRTKRENGCGNDSDQRREYSRMIEAGNEVGGWVSFTPCHPSTWTCIYRLVNCMYGLRQSAVDGILFI